MHRENRHWVHVRTAVSPGDGSATELKSYEVFKSEMMKSDNLKFIKGEVEIISAGGEF